MSACLSVVGVGPGDPELITLKGARRIREAEVVVTPVGDRSDSSIARSIIDGLIDPERQDVLCQVFPMRKDQQGLESSWAESARQLAELVEAGKKVTFVTLGDPFLYSTFLYLYRELKERYPQVAVEVVSGVSSIHAASALAGVPLGLADERLAILPATYEAQRLRRTLKEFDTVVLMKVHRVFARVLSLLTELGLEKKAVYVKRVGLEGEACFSDLGTVTEADLDYLSMVIVKK